MDRIRIFPTLNSLLSPQEITLLQDVDVPVFVGESVVVKYKNLLELILSGFFDTPEKILERHSYTELDFQSAAKELWCQKDKHIDQLSQYINLVVRREINLMNKDKKFPALLHIIPFFPYNDRRYDEVIEVSFTKNNIQFGFKSIEYLFFKGDFFQFKQEIEKMIKKHTTIYSPPEEEIKEIHSTIDILK